jgi:5-methyltetrahydropteroyltriglutamate--homocysteine methyltransferase
MNIPTEPIGSIPRPPRLIEAITTGDATDPRLDTLYEEAIRDPIERFEATGSQVLTDGEQRKHHNFWTYGVQGLPNTAPDGFQIPFAAGHTSTTRDTAFAKIWARVLGAALAPNILGGGQ